MRNQQTQPLGKRERIRIAKQMLTEGYRYHDVNARLRGLRSRGFGKAALGQIRASLRLPFTRGCSNGYFKPTAPPPASHPNLSLAMRECAKLMLKVMASEGQQTVTLHADGRVVFVHCLDVQGPVD